MTLIQLTQNGYNAVFMLVLYMVVHWLEESINIVIYSESMLES